MNKIINILILFFLVISNTAISQSELGIKGGINNSSFFNYFSKPDYNSNYKSFNNYSFSIFYKRQFKETEFYGFELENKGVKSKFEMNYHAGHASFYHNVIYNLNLINLYFIYEKSIFSYDKLDFRINISPYIGYMIKSHARGTGWKYVSVSDIDTNGNNISYLTTNNWSKNENNTKDLNKFIMGARLGLALILPLSERFSVSFNNSYCIVLNNVLRINDARYTGLGSVELEIGVHYHFAN